MASQTSNSLLQRAKVGSELAWQKMVDLYAPLVRDWLHRLSVTGPDEDDVVQEVLMAIMRDLETFEHSGRPGAFRNWLRTTTVHRCRQLWDARKRRRAELRSEQELTKLRELETDGSDLHKQWDEEYDARVFARLIEMMAVEFDSGTMDVFRRIVLNQETPGDVAKSLDLPPAQVYKAKFRVMQRLRDEAAGLLDD